LNVLDQWIFTRFVWLTDFVKEKLLDYNVKAAASEIENFVSDFSTWYIRRSRDRVWVNSQNKEDKKSFYQTTYGILVNLSIILSPFLPFISEEIYTNLTGNESVHLEKWPDISSKFKFQNSKLLEEMKKVREIVEVGHRVRKELKIKVRQPLSSVEIKLAANFDEKLKNLIAAELNVKKVILDVNKKTEGIKVKYDVKLTDSLIKEGEVRNLIRQIQEERKKLAARPDQKITLTLPGAFKEFENQIGKKVIAKKINYGSCLKVEL